MNSGFAADSKSKATAPASKVAERSRPAPVAAVPEVAGPAAFQLFTAAGVAAESAMGGRQTGAAAPGAPPANTLNADANRLGAIWLQLCARVSHPDDPLEREADRVAAEVTSTPSTASAVPTAPKGAPPRAVARHITNPPAITLARNAGPRALLFRSCPCENEELPVLRADLPAGPGLEDERSTRPPGRGPPLASHDVLTALAEGGSPLPASVRMAFEGRLGADFGAVRIHTGRSAEWATRALSARAVTYGTDIAFGPGEFAPGSATGRRLIAHELTHVVQQGAAPTRAPPSGSHLGPRGPPAPAIARSPSGVVQRGILDDARSAWSGVTDTASQAWDGATEAASEAWQGTKEVAGQVWQGAKDVAGQAVEAGEDFLLAQIESLAPGVMPFLRGIESVLFDRISAAADGLFGGMVSRIREQGLVGAVEGILGDLLGPLAEGLGNLASGACHGLVQGASALVDLAKKIGGPIVDAIRTGAIAVGEFFSDVWQRFVAPALEAIQSALGTAWNWIVEKARWLWDVTQPIRSTIAEAWNLLKRIFHIAWDSAGGVLDWLKEHAIAAWNRVKALIEPILGPLKAVAAALLLLSPVGPIVAVVAAAPYVWDALQWLWQHWGKQALSDLRDELREHVLPVIMSGVQTLGGLLDQAGAFLSSAAAAVSTAFKQLAAAVSASPIFQVAKGAVAFLADQFGQFATWAKTAFVSLLGQARNLLRKIYEFVKPVLELLRQALLIYYLGPWAILDDGVWHSIMWFVQLGMRNSCFREIAGFMHLAGILDHIEQFRAMLKAAWAVMQNPDVVIEAIRTAVGEMVAKIPAMARAAVDGAFGSGQGRHVEGVLRHLGPHLTELIENWWEMLKTMAWDLLWPWPGVFKAVGEIGTTIDAALSSLGTLSFSEVGDALVKVWRSLNSMAGLLWGWFAIAAVLIGTVIGAFGGGVGAIPGAQAGWEVAAVVGEGIMLSTVAAEGAAIQKAELDLASPRETPQQAEVAYEQIANSVFTLAVIGAMVLLSDIAVRFAKAAWGEIVGAIRGPRAEVPVAEPAPTAQPGAETPRTEPPRTEPRPGEEPAVPEEKPTVPEEKPATPEEPTAPEEKPGQPPEEKPPGAEPEELPQDLAQSCTIGSVVCPSGLPKKVLKEVADYPNGDRVPEPKGRMEVRGSKDPEYRALRDEANTRFLRRQVLDAPEGGWTKEFRAEMKAAKTRAAAEGRTFDPMDADWPRDANNKAWEVHHRKPLDFGGNNSPNNLVPIEKGVHSELTSWWRSVKRSIGSRFTEAQWSKLVGGSRTEIFDSSAPIRR